MRDKAKLRMCGWAGEVTTEEAQYIKEWLINSYIRERGLAPYENPKTLFTLDNARAFARGNVSGENPNRGFIRTDLIL